MAHVHGQPFADDDLIAYFCAEFGFHESLPIYSGGLGILAGDHCKAASDMGLPFIGVGLLYRQGYFQQTLTADGHQQATYNDSDFDDLPVSPVLDANGQEVLVAVEFPGRTIQAKVWEVTVRPRPADPARHLAADQQRARPRNHPPPLRRRQDDTHRTGNPARRRRHTRPGRAGSEADGLARQ